MRYLSLLLLCVSSAFATTTIAWKANATISNGDLTGRATALVSVNVPGIFTGLYYTSFAYQASQGSAQADGVFGAAYATLLGPLTAYLSYFESKATWTGGSDPKSADVSGAASLVGAAYLGLVEVDTDGKALGGIWLRSLTWSVSTTVTDGPLKYATFTGTSVAHANFSFSATFAAADRPITLTNGALVHPKNLQATLEIVNYPFTVDTSKLKLVIAVATASGSAAGSIKLSRDGFNRIVAGKGNSAVYFDGNSKVIVNGTERSVTVESAGAVTGDFDGAGFLKQFDDIKAAKASSIDVSYQIVNVTFDTQSDHYIYDPSISASEAPDAGESAASSLFIQTPLLVLFAFLALLGARVF